MNMINSLFGQFAPNTIALIPLQIIASILAITWASLLITNNIFPGNWNYIWNNTQLNIINFIFQTPNSLASPWILPLFSIFLIILSINLFGLLPYAFTITSHISFTYSIAIPVWLSINILGFYLAFNSRLSHLVPQGTPNFLIPLMVWIETVSLLAQPIALGLRLAANLTAGHLLIFLLSTTTWVLKSNIILGSLTTIILILLFILEIGVACIQAYVFTSLVNFYLNQNT